MPRTSGVSKEFIKIIEDFEQKIKKGKASKDAYHKYIAVKPHSNKLIHAVNASETDTIKASQILHRLQKTLTANKDMIEAASKMIEVPTQQIKSALDDLTRYVDEIAEKSKSISRKDLDGLKKQL